MLMRSACASSFPLVVHPFHPCAALCRMLSTSSTRTLPHFTSLQLTKPFNLRNSTKYMTSYLSSNMIDVLPPPALGAARCWYEHEYSRPISDWTTSTVIVVRRNETSRSGFITVIRLRVGVRAVGIVNLMS
ncbi:hypothetical protein HOY82DRAFT_32719 [Tuber indicum]|nr:hypothetical protein HOY82DRAFT_32719 [Tuber indicum]